MNLEKTEELFLAVPFPLGHTTTAVLRIEGKMAVWSTTLIWFQLHLSLNKAMGWNRFQFGKQGIVLFLEYV